jgi:hypothetical protein
VQAAGEEDEEGLTDFPNDGESEEAVAEQRALLTSFEM